VDAAAAMVEVARRRYPATTFVQASVTELPFADECFDAAVGNIVIQHVGRPERAAGELARVLARGGRVALSTWDAPERSPFFATLLGALADAQAPAPSDVPAGPSFFQFADEAAFQSLLRSAGFVQVSVDTISVEFPLDCADDPITALADGTVRTGALLRAADDAHRRAIGESLDARLEEWRRGDRYVVPAPVKIASGRKPD
jgi:SAM-dependent methyltransferase